MLTTNLRCFPPRRKVAMAEPVPTPVDALATIREQDGDTFGPEFDVLRFLSDYSASYVRCTTCGIRLSREAQKACATCS